MLSSPKYGVTSESTHERLQALNKGARERAWWDKYRDDVSPTYPDYVGFEAGAAFIRQFESWFVPGVLETRQYAVEVAESSVKAPRVKPIVEMRLRRQSELAQRSPQP